MVDIGNSQPVNLDEFLNVLSFFGFEEKLIKSVLDSEIWTEVSSGTGNLTYSTSGIINLKTGATSGGVMGIMNLQNFPISNRSIGSENQFSSFNLEFSAKLNNADSVDDSAFIMGLQSDISANKTRTDANVVGFILNSNLLSALCDASGTEEITDISEGIDIENWNTYRIKNVNSERYEFYVNNVLVATHSTSLPSLSRINFYFKNDDNVDCNLGIVGIRSWFE